MSGIFKWNFLGAFIVVLSLTASIGYGTRGNDFGNAGDPVREVFNAGRVFALDILSVASQTKEEFLTPQERRDFDDLLPGALQHLQNAEHQWGPWVQNTCARNGVTEAEVVRLSYDLCTRNASDAALASTILVELALRSTAQVAQLPRIKVLTKQLIDHWAATEPHAKAKAKAFSLNQSRTMVSGDWMCRSKNGQDPEVLVRVSPEGLMRTTAMPFATKTRGSSVEFVSFLTLDPSRAHFRAVGVVKIARPAPGEHDNVILAPTCDYPFASDLLPQAGDEMVIRMSGGGRPNFYDGCSVLAAATRDLICKRQ